MKTVLNRSDFERLRSDWIRRNIAAKERGEYELFPLWAKITIRIVGGGPVHNLTTMRRIIKSLLGGESFYLDYTGVEDARRTEFILHTTENYKRFMTWCRLKGFDPTISDSPSQTWINGRATDIPSAWCYVVWTEPTDPFAMVLRSLDVMKKGKRWK